MSKVEERRKGKRKMEIEVWWDPQVTNWESIVMRIQRFKGVTEAFKTSILVPGE